MTSKRLASIFVAFLASILAFALADGAFVQPAGAMPPPGLSKSIFPKTLEGFPLQEIEEIEIEDWERKEYGVKECYVAYYYDERGEIDIDIVLLQDEKKTAGYMEKMITATKEALREIRDAECGE